MLSLLICWYEDEWLLSSQVHEHLPIYTTVIQEFQNRLDHLQIEQAKLAETLASDKRYCQREGIQGFGEGNRFFFLNFELFSNTAVRRWR